MSYTSVITMRLILRFQSLQVFFKLLKAFQVVHVFLAGISRPTNRTTSYKVYIASCPVKRKRSGFLLLPPSIHNRCLDSLRVVEVEKFNKLAGGIFIAIESFDLTKKNLSNLHKLV